MSNVNFKNGRPGETIIQNGKQTVGAINRVRVGEYAAIIYKPRRERTFSSEAEARKLSALSIDYPDVEQEKWKYIAEHQPKVQPAIRMGRFNIEPYDREAAEREEREFWENGGKLGKV